MDLIEYGKNFIGVEYSWGGKTMATGLDCSGFISELLKAFGFIPYNAVMNSQMLGNYLVDRYHEVETEHDMPNAILFYGKSKTQITHIALGINHKLVLEAAGEGRKASDNGWVRVRPANNRRDLVLAIDLDAPIVR